tara:strand:+ start:147 stop:398 length:252 start_codon:yes stop_codon:yes gene_type:complete
VIRPVIDHANGCESIDHIDSGQMTGRCTIHRHLCAVITGTAGSAVVAAGPLGIPRRGHIDTHLPCLNHGDDGSHAHREQQGKN